MSRSPTGSCSWRRAATHPRSLPRMLAAPCNDLKHAEAWDQGRCEAREHSGGDKGNLHRPMVQPDAHLAGSESCFERRSGGVARIAALCGVPREDVFIEL